MDINSKKHPVDKLADECSKMMSELYQAATESNIEMAKAVNQSTRAVEATSNALSKVLDINKELQDKTDNE